MTNTTLNVPRELMERAWRALANSATGREIGAYLDADPCAPECAETCARASMCSTCSATLSATSPAGVGGLEVVGWYRMDDRKAITPYPSVCATWHKMGVKVGAAYSDSAQAIIDGLRGEVARLQRAEKNDAIAYKAALERQDELRTERDQHAKRIGELEGLLQQSYQQVNSECMDWAKEYERRKEVQAERDSLISMLREFAVGISKREMPTEQELNDWFYRIDAALSAGKDYAP